MPGDLRLDELERAAVEARDAADAEDAFVVRTPGCESRPSQNPEYRAAWQRSADAHDALATLADPQTVLLLIAAARERDRLAGERDGLRELLALERASHADTLGALKHSQAERDRLADLIRLRCGYILGTCRGEEEMRAESRAMLAVLGEGGGG